MIEVFKILSGIYDKNSVTCMSLTLSATSVVTKALVVETEAKAEAVASKTEAQAVYLETEAQGSWLILLAVPCNHL